MGLGRLDTLLTVRRGHELIHVHNHDLASAFLHAPAVPSSPPPGLIGKILEVTAEIRGKVATATGKACTSDRDMLYLLRKSTGAPDWLLKKVRSLCSVADFGRHYSDDSLARLLADLDAALASPSSLAAVVKDTPSSTRTLTSDDEASVLSGSVVFDHAKATLQDKPPSVSGAGETGEIAKGTARSKSHFPDQQPGSAITMDVAALGIGDSPTAAIQVLPRSDGFQDKHGTDVIATDAIQVLPRPDDLQDKLLSDVVGVNVSDQQPGSINLDHVKAKIQAEPPLTLDSAADDTVDNFMAKPVDNRQLIQRNWQDAERISKRIANAQKDLVSKQKAVAELEARTRANPKGAKAQLDCGRALVKIFQLKNSCALTEELIASLKRDLASCWKADAALRGEARQGT